MIKKFLWALMLPLLLSATAASAVVLDFDDGSFDDPDGSISYVYKGLSWYNLQEVKDETAGGFGESASFPYALKTVNDTISEISISAVNPGTKFHFNGFNVRLLGCENFTIGLKGYAGGAQMFSANIILNPKAYTYYANTGYDSVLIDTLVIDRGTVQSSLNLDDFDFEPVPEPSSMILGLIGIAGLGKIRKRKQ